MLSKSLVLRVASLIGCLLLVLPASPNIRSSETQTALATAAFPAASVSGGGSAVLSIPGSAFTPEKGYYQYQNSGRFLFHYAGLTPSDPGVYVAPLNLPQGATITRITFFFKDLPTSTPQYAKLSIDQHVFGPYLGTPLGTLQSTDTWPPGYGSSSLDATGPFWQIDNQICSYYLELELPPSPSQSVGASGVQITYTPPPQSTNAGLLNVMPAGFTPFEPGYTFTNVGYLLTHEYGPAYSNANGLYLAPVHLPQGATVAKMTFYWARAGTPTVTATAKLQRSRLGQDTYEDLAIATSVAGTTEDYGSSSDDTIVGGVIDNTQYAYWVVMDLPATPWPSSYVQGREVQIEFTYPTTQFQPIAVPAGAFQPFEDGYSYRNHARHLFHLSSGAGADSGSRGWYLAGLYLPDGVVISKMTFYWYTDSTTLGIARLQRTKLGEGNYQDLAVLYTGDPTGIGSVSTTSIAGGPVDNSQYAYWLLWDLPPNQTLGINVQGHGVVLEIGQAANVVYPVYLPLTFK